MEQRRKDADLRRVRGQKGARERSVAKFVTARATQCLALHAVSLRRGGGVRFESPLALPRRPRPQMIPPHCEESFSPGPASEPRDSALHPNPGSESCSASSEPGRDLEAGSRVSERAGPSPALQPPFSPWPRPGTCAPRSYSEVSSLWSAPPSTLSTSGPFCGWKNTVSDL